MLCPTFQLALHTKDNTIMSLIKDFVNGTTTALVNPDTFNISTDDGLVELTSMQVLCRNDSSCELAANRLFRAMRTKLRGTRSLGDVANHLGNEWRTEKGFLKNQFMFKNCIHQPIIKAPQTVCHVKIFTFTLGATSSLAISPHSVKNYPRKSLRGVDGKIFVFV